MDGNRSRSQRRIALVTSDDIVAIRVQISRISDLNSGNKQLAIEQTSYVLSRMLDLIENLSQQEPPCHPNSDISHQSQNPLSSI